MAKGRPLQHGSHAIALFLRCLPDAQILESVDAHARSRRTLPANDQSFEQL